MTGHLLENEQNKKLEMKHFIKIGNIGLNKIWYNSRKRFLSFQIKC